MVVNQAVRRIHNAGVENCSVFMGSFSLFGVTSRRRPGPQTRGHRAEVTGRGKGRPTDPLTPRRTEEKQGPRIRYMTEVVNRLAGRRMTVDTPLVITDTGGPHGIIRVVDAIWDCPWNVVPGISRTSTSRCAGRVGTAGGCRWVMVEPPGRVPQDQDVFYGFVRGLGEAVPPVEAAAAGVYAITDLRGWGQHRESRWAPHDHTHLVTYEIGGLADALSAATGP